MLTESILEISAAGILVLLILRAVFDFIEKRKSNTGNCTKRTFETCINIEKVLYEVKSSIDELYKWHDKEDDEGVKVWYMRKSLEEAIVKLGDNIEAQTEIMRMLVNDIKIMDHDHKDKGK